MLHLRAATPLCTYLTLDHCVHQMTFKTPSAQAIDQLFEHMTSIYQQTPPNQPVRLIFDIRQSGLLPMAYTAQKARRWLAHRDRPQPTCIAFIYRKLDFPVDLVQTFFRLARLEMDYQMAFFAETQMDHALAWLTGTSA